MTTTRIPGEANWPQFEKDLDGWEFSIGVPGWKGGLNPVENEAVKYLRMGDEETRALPPEQAASAAATVARYAGHLSRAAARERVQAKWAYEETNRLLVAEGLLEQVHGYSWEERRLKAVGLDSEAASLDDIRREAEARADRLSYAAKHAGDVAESLKALAHVRRRVEHG